MTKNMRVCFHGSHHIMIMIINLIMFINQITSNNQVNHTVQYNWNAVRQAYCSLTGSACVKLREKVRKKARPHWRRSRDKKSTATFLSPSSVAVVAAYVFASWRWRLTSERLK